MTHAEVLLLLFTACLCCSPNPCKAARAETFSFDAVDCRIDRTENRGLPPKVSANCSSLQNVDLKPQQNIFDRIITEVFQRIQTYSSQLKKLTLNLSNLHLSLEATNVTHKGKQLYEQMELNLNHCSIQSLKRGFFASRLYFDSNNPGSVRFHNCKFVSVACTDLATAFDSQLTLLEFVNCIWCSGDVSLTKLNVRDLELRQATSQPETTLWLNDSSFSNKLVISIDSSWQRVRLGSVRPGNLNLTGVELVGPLGPSFLDNAKMFALRLQRCHLPPDAANDMLRNVKDVDEIIMDGTDLTDLPLVPQTSKQKLWNLEIRNCQLDRLEFKRLEAAVNLKQLRLQRASIKQLPESWNQVVQGIILPELTLIVLTGNAIRRLPEVPNGRTYSDKKRFEVLLGENPFLCDCRLKWLGSPELNIQQVFRSEDPICSSPEQLRGQRVSDAFRRFDPCKSEPPQPSLPSPVPGSVTTGVSGEPADAAPTEASASIIAIVVVTIVVLIAATILLVLCCKFKDRVCASRESHAKVKYTAANKDEVGVSDKTTILSRSDGTRPTNV